MRSFPVLLLAIVAGAVVVAVAHRPESASASAAPDAGAAARHPHGFFSKRVRPEIEGIGRMSDLPTVELPAPSRSSGSSF